MSEWHVAPNEILDGWTEELFALMFEKRGERYEAMRRAQKGDAVPEPAKRISDLEMFRLPGCSYSVVKVPQAN